MIVFILQIRGIEEYHGCEAEHKGPNTFNENNHCIEIFKINIILYTQLYMCVCVFLLPLMVPLLNS